MIDCAVGGVGEGVYHHYRDSKLQFYEIYITRVWDGQSVMEKKNIGKNFPSRPLEGCCKRA